MASLEAGEQASSVLNPSTIVRSGFRCRLDGTYPSAAEIPKATAARYVLARPASGSSALKPGTPASEVTQTAPARRSSMELKYSVLAGHW